MDRNHQLENLISEYRSIMLAKSHLYRLELRLQTEKRNLLKLENILEKEYQDLERFKDTSVRKLFFKVLKSREEQYEIEKQEYLHAVLQFKDCKNIIELLEFEQGVLEEKISKEKVIKQQVDSLVSQRNLMISKKYVGFKNTMIALSAQLDQKLAYKKEIHEALIAGLKASDVFKKMIQLIKKAKSEGGWGMKNYHKLGEESSRHSYVDQAHKLSYRAKQILQELQDEMEDVYKHKDIKRLNRMEDFQHFNELYHDRLISDWIVKNKIVSTLNYLRGTADTLTQIVETLKIQLKMTEKEIAYILVRKQDVINENIE